MQLVNLKRLSILTLLVIAASCVSATPVFNPKFTLFSTNSERAEVRRGNTVCKTNEPCFDALICMPVDQPRRAVEACQAIINQCERWKPAKK